MSTGRVQVVTGASRFQRHVDLSVRSDAHADGTMVSQVGGGFVSGANSDDPPEP
jgi:hypothetical protein